MGDEANVVDVVDSPTDDVTKDAQPAQSSAAQGNPDTPANDTVTGVAEPEDTIVLPGAVSGVAPPPDLAPAPDVVAAGVAAVPDVTPDATPTQPDGSASGGGARGDVPGSGEPGQPASANDRGNGVGDAPGATTHFSPGVADPTVDSRHDDGWQQPGDWQVDPPARQLDHPYPEPHETPPHRRFEESDEYDDEYAEEYDDGALFATILSAPSLALAAFVFALTGLLGGMIPESLPYLVQIDPGNGPAYHVRIIGLIALGFAIVAASLGLASMLRSIGSPLRWPRYLGGAAVLLALLIALQSVLLIVLAGLAPEQGAMN